MNKLNNSNWSNLPKEIILQILTHLPHYFRPDLKLINKHWNSSVSHSIYYSLGDLNAQRSKHLINNHPQLIRELGIYQVTFNPSILEKCDKLVNLQELVWNLGSLEYLYDLINLLKKNRNFKVLYLTDFFNEQFTTEFTISLQRLSDSLSSFQNLKCICFNMNATQLYPILEGLPNIESIEELSIELQPSQLLVGFEFIKSIQKLKMLDLKVVYQFTEHSNIDKLSKLFSNNSEFAQKLKELSISLHYYDSFSPQALESHSTEDLISFLQNPNLKNLKLFRYSTTGDCIRRFSGKLNSPLNPPTCGFNNLTKLNLFIIDSYLMTYLTIKCPNLKELATNSHLVLPYKYESAETKPFKYLTKLRISGFDKKLSKHADLVKKFLPSVTTLCLHKYETANSDYTSNTSYIPILFPNLTNMLFKSEGFEFKNLLTLPSELLKWRELYITSAKLDIATLTLLLQKLPNLCNFYLDYQNPRSDIDRFEFGECRFKVFRANCWDVEEFEFNVKKEIILV
jgi:hypothetical protein